MTDEAGQRLGHSATAAKQGIFQVVISRIGMAIPAMGEAEMAGGAQEAGREEGLGGGVSLITQSASLGRMGASEREALPHAPAACFTISLTALLTPQPFPR